MQHFQDLAHLHRATVSGPSPDPSSRGLKGTGRGLGRARAVEQPRCPRGRQRQQARQRVERSDAGKLAHVALHERVEVVRVPAGAPSPSGQSSAAGRRASGAVSVVNDSAGDYPSYDRGRTPHPLGDFPRVTSPDAIMPGRRRARCAAARASRDGLDSDAKCDPIRHDSGDTARQRGMPVMATC
jgi:hypothetical protein